MAFDWLRVVGRLGAPTIQTLSRNGVEQPKQKSFQTCVLVSRNDFLTASSFRFESSFCSLSSGNFQLLVFSLLCVEAEMPFMQADINDFEKLDKIGEGTYGKFSTPSVFMDAACVVGRSF